MTSDEYLSAVGEIVKDLPKSFRMPICIFCEQAFESCSYEGVLEGIESLVNEVIKPGLTEMTEEEYAGYNNK